MSWHDTTNGNTGCYYRRNTDADVDIARDDTGGYAVGWAKAGEWLEYTINVPAGAAGTYDLTSHVAAPGDPDNPKLTRGTFHWELNGSSIGGVGGTLTVPNTNGMINRAFETEFTIAAGASYPFVAFAPEINWSFQLSLRTTADRETTYVSLRGAHDQFPAYGVYSGADQSDLEYTFRPSSEGPGLWNLGSSTPTIELTWIV